jgi:hypothetical protein
MVFVLFLDCGSSKMGLEKRSRKSLQLCHNGRLHAALLLFLDYGNSIE